MADKPPTINATIRVEMEITPGDYKGTDAVECVLKQMLLEGPYHVWPKGWNGPRMLVTFKRIVEPQ